MENYLAHYGVLGMKWGVRRYQNEDGTYTRKGRERYSKQKEEYANTKREYKEGRVTKKDLRNSRKKLAEASIELQRSKLADEGKKLTAAGKDIYSVNQKAVWSSLKVRTGAAMVSNILQAYAPLNIARLSTKTLDIGSKAYAAYKTAEAMSDSIKLTEYERHRYH